MASSSSFVFLAGLFFLVTNERGSGLPTNVQSNGLTNEERVHIRKVLELALRELKDEDVLHVLKESLTLRFKVCLSPFPPPPPFAEGITDAYGIMEDEEFSPEQKKGLRELLLECLELVDEQEILDFLKSSIDFRIQYCHWTGDFSGTRRPVSKLGVRTTQIPTPEPQRPTTEPSAPTPGRTPGKTGDRGSSTSAPLTAPEASEPATRERAAEGENPTIQTADFPADDMADALSSIYRGKNRARVVGNGPAEKIAERVSSKRDDIPDAIQKFTLEDTLSSISQQNEMLASSSRDSSPHQEVALEDTLSAISRQDEMSDSSRDNFPPLVIRKDPAANSANQLSKKLGLPALPYLSSKELVSDKELSESLISEPDPRIAEEPERGNDQPIVGASEEVRKAVLQEKERSSQMMEANSNEGEFSSVMRIDYSELEDEQEEPRAVGVDLGLIVEPNEELSL